MPNSDSNPVAGVLGAFGGANAANQVAAVPSSAGEELLNTTLAGFPGGAEAFWEGMQGSGIGRQELLQMLASEMHQSCEYLSDNQGSFVINI